MIILDLYATGFNAHNQLSLRPLSSNPSDILRFTKLATLPRAKVLYAGWSDTILILDSDLHLLGHRGHSVSNTVITTPHDDPERLSFFGDHAGVVGAIDSTTGECWHLRPSATPANSPISLVPAHFPFADPPIIAALAVASSSLTAAAVRPAPGCIDTHVVEFASPRAFATWYANPSDPALYPSGHRVVGGRVRALAAGACFFVALDESGGVHTWGDARFPACLGREVGGRDEAATVGSVGGEGPRPARTPTVVDALGGVRVKKVVAGGGWMAGALSEDGAFYVWGMGAPGDVSEGGGEAIAALKNDDCGDDVQLVSVGGDADVLDAAMGSGHAMVLTEGGKVFAAGRSRNGQLGLAEQGGNFVAEWTEVEDLEDKTIVEIRCGDQCTFAVGIPPEGT